MRSYKMVHSQQLDALPDSPQTTAPVALAQPGTTQFCRSCQKALLLNLLCFGCHNDRLLRTNILVDGRSIGLIHIYLHTAPQTDSVQDLTTT